MPNFVQEFRSTDVGMPVLSGTAGALIALLDAVLVNGGATQAVTSLTEVGTTINAVIPADVTLETNDWLVIAGAAPAGANGTFKVTMADSTHFSYVGPGSLGAITGSITYRRAPLGWTKPFTGANLAAFRAASVPNCPQFYLRVDETGATLGGQKEVAVRGYEAMTDVNTGTGPFPTVAQQTNGLCWRKSLTADATARAWVLIGDGATFYFIPNSDASAVSGRGNLAFGAFTSFKPSDAYNALLSGWSTFNVTTVSSSLAGLAFAQTTGTFTPGSSIYTPRTVSGAVLGAAPVCQINRWGIASGSIGSAAASGAVAYPSPADGALWVDSTIIMEGTNIARGRPRGMYVNAHTGPVFANDFDTATNIAGLPGVTLISYLTMSNSQSGNTQFDRFGPW